MRTKCTDALYSIIYNIYFCIGNNNYRVKKTSLKISLTYKAKHGKSF
jgi:hypothetical protein